MIARQFQFEWDEVKAAKKNVWEYFAGKAQQQSVELLTEVLQRDIEINGAPKWVANIPMDPEGS